MKMPILAALAAALAGCASGVTQEEMQTMKQEILAHEAQEAARLRSELTGVDQKYVSVQQLQLKVEKQLREIEDFHKQIAELTKATEAKVDLANGNVLKVLEFEERLLADRLASLRGMIAELKKK